MAGHLSDLIRHPLGTRSHGIAGILQWGVTAGALAVSSFWVASLKEIPDTVAIKSIDSPAPPPRQRIVVTRREIEVLTQETFFIVASEARAEQLRIALEEDCGVRLNMGLEPLNDVVIVAATDSEAATIMATITEGNRMRVDMYLSEARIIDLR